MGASGIHWDNTCLCQSLSGHLYGYVYYGCNCGSLQCYQELRLYEVPGSGGPKRLPVTFNIFFGLPVAAPELRTSVTLIIIKVNESFG